MILAAYCFLCLAGFFAGLVSGIIGTGASLMLMPILVPIYGVTYAAPMMAVAGLMANLARIIAWHRDTDWRAVITYVTPGIPAAYLGAALLISLPSGLAEGVLGLFIVALVPARHFIRDRFAVRLMHLAVAGGLIGFLTGMFLSTGPLSLPVFMNYGLAKGGLLSTEAASSLPLQLAKLTGFRNGAALPPEKILQGFGLGLSMMVGTFLSRKVVARIGDHHFERLTDWVTVISGILLVAGSFQWRA